MKEYRACCLAITLYVADPPGDCPHKPTRHWPQELHPYARRVLNEAELVAA